MSVQVNSWNFLFHGEFLDTDGELYNYGYRYYDPPAGPLVEQGPYRRTGRIQSKSGAQTLIGCIRFNFTNAIYHGEKKGKPGDSNKDHKRRAWTDYPHTDSNDWEDYWTADPQPMSNFFKLALKNWSK